jgi:rhodanese-related sulfurtransferase/rubrerythrin
VSITDLTPEELRNYLQSHHEKAFRLIDVRQPGEYEMVHIPGAQLLPLPELMQDLENLPKDKELIFYCRSGARSATAAVMVAEETDGNIKLYNLEGGILAWEGAMVDDLPRIALFEQRSAEQMMATAMNLEKGALRFYSHVQSAFGQYGWSEIFGSLGQVETAHAKTIYHFWQQINNTIEPFEPLFDRLGGEVLEGGQALDEVLQTIGQQGKASCMELVELAMKMEYRAYDLYRTMADQAAAAEAREAFITIAQAEKGHMQALVKAIEAC